MTKSHWCDRLRPICSGGGGRGRLQACGMRGMNRCDMAVVCTDVCNAWNVGAKCGMCRCRQMWFWNVRNVALNWAYTTTHAASEDSPAHQWYGRSAWGWRLAIAAAFSADCIRRTRMSSRSDMPFNAWQWQVCIDIQISFLLIIVTHRCYASWFCIGFQMTWLLIVISRPTSCRLCVIVFMSG